MRYKGRCIIAAAQELERRRLSVAAQQLGFDTVGAANGSQFAAKRRESPAAAIVIDDGSFAAVQMCLVARHWPLIGRPIMLVLAPGCTAERITEQIAAEYAKRYAFERYRESLQDQLSFDFDASLELPAVILQAAE